MAPYALDKTATMMRHPQRSLHVDVDDDVDDDGMASICPARSDWALESILSECILLPIFIFNFQFCSRLIDLRRLPSMAFNCELCAL